MTSQTPKNPKAPRASLPVPATLSHPRVFSAPPALTIDKDDAPKQVPGLPAAEPNGLPDSDVSSPLRKICFNFLLVLMFLQFSMLHQTIAGLLHINTYLMYVFGIPPFLGLIGGVKYAFGGRQAIYWTGFALWLTLAVPFSTWHGGSAQIASNYWRTDFAMLVMVAGLTLTWKECEKLMTAVACGAVMAIFSARFLVNDETADYGGRFGLQTGTVSNPNDFAGHMILALSFLLWVGTKSKSMIVRVPALTGVVFGILLIMKTGSRGAEVGLAVAVLVYFMLAPIQQKFGLAIAVPLCLIIALLALPSETLRRLGSFSSSAGQGAAATEADESSANRAYLLKTSLKYTLQFPIFGVGPGQFSFYEGSHNTIDGTGHGSWHDTHNSFTQASSECGILGGLFFIGGVGSTILAFRRLYKEAKKRDDCGDIQMAALALLVGSCGFFSAILFLNFAYLFYGPFLGGLAIATSRAAKYEFARRAASASRQTEPRQIQTGLIVERPTDGALVPAKLYKKTVSHRNWGRLA